MGRYNQFSLHKILFHHFPLLEDGSSLAGYSALIEAHGLRVVQPGYLCCIGQKHKKYVHERWRVFTPWHKPGDTLSENIILVSSFKQRWSN